MVWEDKPEEVAEQCKEKLPVLTEIKSKEIRTSTDSPHILIEGDNYHALSVLNYTHKGKIDVIYIDPPYNTGAKDWKYNNHYVDAEDGYRHSKWASFMYKRLKFAKKLLKDDGIICVTIDNYELPRLLLLMEHIFKEENHLGVVVIKNTPSGRKTKRKIALMHEYALFFGKNKSKIKKQIIEIINKSHNYKQDIDGDWYLPTNVRKQGTDSTAKDKTGKYRKGFFPIYYDPKTNKISIDTPLTIKIMPIDVHGNERIWRLSKQTLRDKIKNGDVYYSKTSFGDQLYYKFRGGVDGEMPKSIWLDEKFSSSEYGSRIVDKILGKRESFPFPKSMEAVKACIKAASTDKNATILDFFAGSGTTGHAVLQLNKEDNGKRTFILCTNNENKICEEITLPLLNNVIKGYKFKGKIHEILFEKKITYADFKKNENIIEEIEYIKNKQSKKYDDFNTKIEKNTIQLIGITEIKNKKPGLSGNLKYFKTNFVESAETDKNKKKLVDASTEMLCLKENCWDVVKIMKHYSMFTNGLKNLVIIYDDAGIDSVKQIVKKLKIPCMLYVFSLDEYDYVEEFRDINTLVKLKPIPIDILNLYRRLFK